MAATILTAPEDVAVAAPAPVGSDPAVIYERNKAWAKPGPYETALNPNQEKGFIDWINNVVNKKTIRFDPDEEPQSYDMRGYYKAMLENQVPRRAPGSDAHFPDTFKTPYHESFSRESKYATFDAPQWVPAGRGFNLTDKSGNILAHDPGSAKK